MTDDFMTEAIREADKGISDGDGGPFGCVVVMEGEIVGRGHNRVLSDRDPTCHGEIVAIRDACANLETHDLTGADLYTTGYPCPMCMGAIYWSRISKVYYGCTVEDAHRIGFRDLEMYAAVRRKADFAFQIDHERCLELYRRYEEADPNRYRSDG